MSSFKALCMASLLLFLSFTMGCTFPGVTDPTYYADLDLKFTVENASSGGHVLLPILLENDGTSLTPLSHNILSLQTCPVTIVQDPIGKMLDMTLTKKTCVSEGQDHIKGTHSIARTEEYLRYTWTSINSTIHATSLPTKATKPDDPANQTTNPPWLKITITFVGKSDMCNRHASFTGELPQDGFVHQLQGNDRGVCKQY